MSFSDDAIGFYLQINDQLSPALATAERNYNRFVQSLDKYNQRAERSANRGMRALADVVDGFRELPKVAEQAYGDAMRRMRNQSKPLEQKVNLTLTARAEQRLGRTIGEAVARVLAKVKLRLTAEVPLRKSTFFDTGVALRTAYKATVQPPDMAGMFGNLPRFQEGGMVEGPPGIDKVLALLTKGEMVLPVKAAERLAAQMQALGALKAREMLPVGLPEAVADIQNLSFALQRAQDLVELGVFPMAEYTESVNFLSRRYEDLSGIVRTVGEERMPKFITVLKSVKALVDPFAKSLAKAGKELTGTDESLKKISKATRFLAMHKALKTVQEGLQKLTDSVSTTFTTLEGEQIGNFVENINKMNSRLGLSREELRDFKSQALDVLHTAVPAGTVSMSEFSAVMEGIAEQGPKDRNVILALTPAIALMAKASTASAESLQKAGVLLQDLAGFEPDQIAAVFERTRLVAKNSFSDAQQLTDNMLANIDRGGREFLKLSTERQGNFLNNLTNLSAATANVWGEDSDKIAEVMAEAFAGNTEAMQKFTQLTGKSFKEFAPVLTEAGGDMAPVLEAIGARFKELGPIGFTAMAQTTLGVDLSNRELGALVEKNEEAVATLHKLRGISVDSGKAMKGLGDAARNNQTVFENLKIQVGDAIGNFEVFGVKGIEVVDALKELPPSLVLSTIELGRMGVGILKMIPGVVKLGASVLTMAAKAIFWLGAKAAAWIGLGTAQTTAAAASKTASATMATSTGGLSKSAMSLGRTVSGFLTSIATGLATTLTTIGGGIASFVTSLAASVGTALGSIGSGIAAFLTSVGGGLAAFLTSLATGLVALTPAIPVILTLAAAFVAVGAALWLAKEPLVAMFNLLGTVVESVAAVLGKAIDGIVAIVSSLKEMDPLQMLALAGSLVLLGPGFISLGAGIFALSVSLGLSTVGFLAFGGVMALLGGVGRVSSMAGIIDTLVDTFAANPGRMKKAAEAMRDTVSFVSGLMKVMAGISALAVGAAIGGLVTGVLGWFGVKSPFAQLVDQAKEIKHTIVSIANTFASLSGSDMRNLLVARAVFAHVAVFMRDYMVIAAMMREAAPSLIGAAVNKIASLFGIASPFERLAAEGAGIATTVQTISAAFSEIGPTVTGQLPGTQQALTATGQLLTSMKPIIASAAEAGELAGTLGDSWFGLWDGPLTKLQVQAPRIFEVVAGISSAAEAHIGSFAEATALAGAMEAIRVTLGETQKMALISKNLVPIFDQLDVEGVQRVAAKAEDVFRSAAQIHASLARAVAAPMEAEMSTLRPNITATVTPAMIQETLMVKLDPNTTDEPVRAELQKTNALLAQLIAVQSGGPAATPVTQPPHGRRPSRFTQDVAGGRH